MKVKKALLLFACFWALGISLVHAQTIQVSGKVISKSSNAGLEGTTVSVKGTTNATTTDKDGNYKITVPRKGSVLVFSYTGMASEEKKIQNADPVNISLAAITSALEEVVVVGYGTQRKALVTGAISSVKAKDLEKVPNGSLEQALQGRVSGVYIASNSGQPGSRSTVRVRGVTSFGGNEPLYVVDGIVVDNGGIGYLNQSDIESIEVLKDAASSSIYGTRAGAGVILVTTKKGRSGKMTVNYNGFWGTSAPAKRLDLLNASEYAALSNEKSVAGGGPIVYPDLSIYGKGTDWQKAIFNNDARRFSHELSLSGGSDRSTFYVSFGFSDQDGIVLTNISHSTKKSVRLNSTHKIGKIVSFGQTLGYTHIKNIGLGNTNSEYGGPLSSAINLDPITPLVETDTARANAAPYNTNPATPVIRDPNGFPYGISPIVGQEMTNPKAYEQTRYGGYSWSDDIVGNGFVEIAPIKSIKIRSTVGGKLAYYGNQGFTPLYYLSATVSNLTQNGLSREINKAMAWTVENTITFNQKFGDHNVNVLAGQGAYVDGIGNQSITSVQNLPITNYTDASFNFDGITEANRTSYAHDFINHKISSLFGRLNYDYKEKYLLTGIVRRDGSSRFGGNNKFHTFTSFSLGWNVAKENFWVPNKYVRSLKIRGGSGVTGQDGNIPDFRYLSTVKGGYNYTEGNAGIISTGYSPVTLDNPNLKWEETRQTNFGFDAVILEDFSLTLDLYNKKTTGILRPVRVPGYVGVSEDPAGNVADMKNTGVDIELGWHKKIGQFYFNVNGNISTLKNTVTYVSSDTNFIPDGDPLNAAFQSMGPVTRIQVGQSYTSFYGFQTAGIFQNVAEVNAYTNKAGGLIQPKAVPGDFRWVDTDGDGAITAKDKVFLGTNIPKVTFGLTINVQFKGFDLMAFGQGAAGNKIFQGLRRLDIGNANYQTKALSRWTGEGTSNTYPRLTTDDTNGNTTNMSDFYLEKGDYLRLKVVTLGYTYGNRYLTKMGITNLRIYLTSENLATLTKYTGYDPEIGGGVLGIDKGYYPQSRSFIAGVQLQF